MTQQHAEEDPIDILEQEARAVAQCFGIAASDDAAAMFVERILLRLGGESIYVPKKRHQDRQRMRDEIRRRFNGANGRALAREFGVSARMVRLIASER